MVREEQALWIETDLLGVPHVGRDETWLEIHLVRAKGRLSLAAADPVISRAKPPLNPGQPSMCIDSCELIRFGKEVWAGN